MAEDKAGKLKGFRVMQVGEPTGHRLRDKAGKATAFIEQFRCVKCGLRLDYHLADGGSYSHISNVDCPNAGKRFKVKTVELEEL